MSKKIQTATFNAELSDVDIIEVYAKVIYSRGCAAVLWGDNMHPGEDDTLEDYQIFDAKTGKEISLEGISQRNIDDIEESIWFQINEQNTDEYDED
jgi:hypothetical protein